MGRRLMRSWGSAYPGLVPGKTDGHPAAAAAWTPHVLVLPRIVVNCESDPVADLRVVCHAVGHAWVTRRLGRNDVERE